MDTEKSTTMSPSGKRQSKSKTQSPESEPEQKEFLQDRWEETRMDNALKAFEELRKSRKKSTPT